MYFKKKNLTYAEETEQKDETDADGSLLIIYPNSLFYPLDSRTNTAKERDNIVIRGETGLAGGGFGPGFRN